MGAMVYGILISLTLFVSGANAVCSKAICAQRKTEFSTIVDHYRQIYCYIDEKQKQYNQNFEDLAAKYSAKVDDVMSADDYVWLLREWAGEFRDGHVNFMSKPGGLDYTLIKFDIKLDLVLPALADEQLVIVASSSSDIPVGSVIQKIDGRDAKALITEMTRFRSGSTEIMRRRGSAAGLLSALWRTTGKTAFEIEFLDAKSTPQKLTVQGTLSTYAKEKMPPNEPSVTSKVYPGGILYIKIDQFSMGETEDDFQNALDKTDMTQIKGILIDVRANRGGAAASYEMIMANFIDSKSSISTFAQSPRITPLSLQYRPSYSGWKLINGTEFGEWTDNHANGINQVNRITQPIVLLSGTACFSACDTFVSAMKHNGVAKVVGEPTAGGTGTPIVFELKESGHQFRYSSMRGRTIHGDVIEGVGTQPEIYIPKQVADIRDQKDYQLEKAMQLFPSFAPNNRLTMKLVKPVNNQLKYSEELWAEHLMGIQE